MIGGQPSGGHFPGPFAAFGLTIGGVLAATLATVFVMGLTGSEPSVASMGVGEALGLGAVASYAARRVAAPQRERLGLKGFDTSFLPILLCSIVRDLWVHLLLNRKTHTGILRKQV